MNDMYSRLILRLGQLHYALIMNLIVFYLEDVMKRKNKHRIIGIAALIILIPAIIYLCFGIGMLSTNSPKAIELDWVKQHKIYITEQYTYLNNVMLLLHLR